MSWVLDQVHGVNSADRLVLLSIANYAEKDGSNAWPSHRTIANEADLHVDTVKRSIRRLAKLGLVKVETNAGGDRDCPPDRRPNRYTLPLFGRTWNGGAADPSREGDAASPPGEGNLHPRGGDNSSERGGSSVTNGGGRASPQSVLDPPRTLAPSGAGESDLVVVLADVVGAQPATEIETARYRKAARELTDAGADPDTVRLAARRFRELWPSAQLTAMGLAANWGLLQLPTGNTNPTQSSRTCPLDICGGSGWTFTPDDATAIPCPHLTQEATQ